MNDSEYSALTENGLFTSLDIYWSTHHKMIPHKGVKMWMVEGGCITRKTFHYYIKSSLFGFSLGYRQSFNSETPGLRILWYQFRMISIAKHADLTKILTEHVNLTNF